MAVRSARLAGYSLSRLRVANYRAAAEEQPRRTPGNYQFNYPPLRGKEGWPIRPPVLHLNLSAAFARAAAIRSSRRAFAAAGVPALCRFNMSATSEWPPSAHFFPPRRLRPCESSQRHNARGPHRRVLGCLDQQPDCLLFQGCVGSTSSGLVDEASNQRGSGRAQSCAGYLRRPIQYATPLLSLRFRANRASKAATRWHRPAKVSRGSVTTCCDSGCMVCEHGGSAKALGMIFLSVVTERCILGSPAVHSMSSRPYDQEHRLSQVLFACFADGRMLA